MRSQPFLKPAFGWFVLAAVAALVAAEILAGTGGGEGRNDALVRARSPRFTVSLQLEEAGISGVFTEVSGLDSENEVIEFRDGNDPNVTRKVPGQLKYPNLVLKRGVTGDASLWQWRRLVETGNIADARSNGTLVLLDRGNPVATWRFVNAWPAKITGPELDGGKNEIAIETLTIVHEGFQRN